MNQQNIILDGSLIFKLQDGLRGIFNVVDFKTPRNAPQGMVIFQGDLLMQDSEAAYNLIAERWKQIDYTPLLRQGVNYQEVIASPGTIEPKATNPMINLILFIVTLASVTLIGALNEGVNLMENPLGILQGLPFAFAILSILLAHEFGHYFLARYHKVSVTLPYFIPFPTLIGTLGAVILHRSPPITRKQTFDIGIAGPLAGLIVAIPVLIYGLLNSEVLPFPDNGQPYLIEGNSILYWSLKYFIFGQSLPSPDGVDVFLHPIALAGWAGLLITFLNLIPVGQLDGGHIFYVLFGQRVKQIGYVILGIMLVLGIFVSQSWLVWAAFVFLLVGVDHPPPLNDLAILDPRRKLFGYTMILIFILLFMPEPMRLVGG